MTTSAETTPPFYLPLKAKDGRRRPGLVVCALSFEGGPGEAILTTRLRWSPAMAARLRAIARQGRDSGRAEGKSLPYASLRAALQTKLPEAVLLAPDLGAPWRREEFGPLLSAEGGPGDLAGRASAALGLWTQMVLTPWADRVGVDDALVDGVAELVEAGGTFEPPDAFATDLRERIASGGSFGEVSHAILQVVSRRLEGAELFDGLGPAYRIVRRKANDNAVEFMTWPTKGNDDARFSMVAAISVETAPYLGRPVLVISARRRRWLPGVPDEKRLRMQSVLRGNILSRNAEPGHRIAVEFAAEVSDGKVGEPFSPEFMIHALDIRTELTAKLSDMVARQGYGDVFVGLPRSSSDGRNGGGSGSSTRDQSDLFQKIAALLEEDGFVPLACEQTPEIKKAPKRAEEHHRGLATEALLADIGLQLGHNDIGEESFREAWEMLASGELPPKLDYAKADKARAELEVLRGWNRQRMQRAFGDLVPRLVLVAPTAQQRTTLRLCIDALFGRSIDVVEHALPPGVHGPRADLGRPKGKARERFADRVERWRPLAEALSRDGIPNHAIVQATDWYERRKDDAVNKPAGRFALASMADANVQYLRPPGSRPQDFANYLHRVQAAAYDLLFGHSGLVSEIGSVLAGGFTDEASRPRAVIGISVVTQARTRTGARGGRLCLATRINAAGGETTARVGWFHNAMRWSAAWVPLFEALKSIAGPEVDASLGDGREVESASFQAFVKTIVDEAVQAGDRPLVLIDSTSAASLWPSLTDRGMPGGLLIGPEQIDVARTWKGARVVRIRMGRAGRLIEAKSRDYSRIGADGAVGSGAPDLIRYCPTITERTVKVSEREGGGGSHYWMTHGYFQMSFPRGLSVYRNLPALMPASKLKVAVPAALSGKAVLCEREVDISAETYRLPRPIDVTVALLQPGDDPDRIAHVVASLRHGYGHTGATTTLPAPLSFEAKARDYMTRFALDEADLEDEGGDGDDADPPDDGPDGQPDDVGGLPDDPVPEPDPAPPPVPNPPSPPTEAEATSRTTGSAGERRANGQGAMVASVERTDGAAGIWSDVPRAPVLPVPDFVTGAWLKPKLSAPNSLLRVIHEWRGEIEDLSGYDGWPERKPGIDEFCEVLADGVRYPNFLRAVTRAATRNQNARLRLDYNLFHPFRNLVSARLGTLRREHPGAREMVDEESLALLCDTGNAEMAAGVIYLISLGPGPRPQFLAVAERKPEHLGSLVPFLRAAEEHMGGDFDWVRDVVNLRGSPTSPPRPKPKAGVEIIRPSPPPGVSDAPVPVAEPATPEEPEAVETPAVSPGETATDAPMTTPSRAEAAHAGGPTPEAAWSEAVSRLAEIATHAGPEPDAGLLAGLRRALADARRAHRAWAASLPRTVDVAAIAAGAVALASELKLDVSGRALTARLAEGGAFDVPADQEGSLRQGLDGIREFRRQADEAEAQAGELMATRDMKRLPDIQALSRMVDEARASAVEGLLSFLERFDGLAAERSSASPAAPSRVEERPEPDPAFGPGIAGEEVRQVVSAAEREDAPTGAGIDDASLELMDELASEDADDDVPMIGIDGTPEADGPDPEVEASQPLDPLVGRIERKLVTLVEGFEPGLAFHLVRAAQLSFPAHEFAFDPDELRLIAMAPYLNHAAMQGNQLLAATLEHAFEAAEHTVPTEEGGRPDLPEEVRQARRLALFGAVSALVLFHPDTVAGQLLSSLRAITAELDGSLYPMREALVEASRSRLILTPAMFRAVNAQAAEDRHSHECRDDIVAKIEAIGRLQFRFQLGTRIRAALVRGDGALGRLHDAVCADGVVALAAAQDFAKTYGERARIIELLGEAEGSANNRRVYGVDGEARERLVANVSELAGLCLTYVQAKEAAPAMSNAGQRALVQTLRASIVAGLECALPALGPLREGTSPLLAQAASFADRMLRRLRDAVDGKLPQVAPYDHLLAVHGGLPWVAGLRFGSSWLPSPYEADTIVARLLQADPGVVGPVPEAFEAAIRRCFDEDGFVAASMLVEQGAFRGIDAALRESMGLMVQANAATRRDKLVADVADARRSVERIQRLGALVGADDGQDLISFLDRIDPARIPDLLQPDARTEAEEPESILDFAAAQAILEDVAFRVGHLLDKPRGDLLAKLDGLVAVGSASLDDAARVRQLVGKDDLLTAGEYLDFIADGRGIPASSSPNPRFKAFFPDVPIHLATHSPARRQLREAMLLGEDVGPLAFSRIPPTRREDAARLYDDWEEVARRVQVGVVDPSNLMALLCTFLDGAGLRSNLDKVDATLSSQRRKVYAADMRLVLEQDAEGVLLPEFGSLTGGNYRVVVLARMPSEVELAPLCANAGAQGVILLVMEAIPRDRRRQLAQDSIKAQRKVLVIDEAILLFALSEKEFRPLTLIECAQPFSFASPYRDYGNQPVPPEIFFGRETEYRKVVEPSGSCIVYGGRRLGKSALLQQVQAKEHAPEAGTAVAYVNVYAIGNNALPSEIWAYASEKLSDVFREPVSSAAEFRAGVTKWLDADGRRRILVLFDEADRFIEVDADDGFREFIPLQGLMDATGRRFKFVLAGLHNVTRLVHTENPPLKQIASEPQRIGPLMNEELREAELLVTRPLAALGYEFQNREDVWRILSHCNYYPVLVQTFCKGLLEALTREAEKARKVLFPITEEHVRRTLENERISGEIAEMFNHTLKIDNRYDLIANIVAERYLRDTAEGRVGEGMSSVEIMEAASRAWPAAFSQNHRLSIIEDLLDEMEGLGVLRRGGDEMWSLRSKAILRLLGNETKIMSRLVEFIDRPAPLPFEPRTMRRELRLSALFKVPKGHSCPLTLGQEHDLLALDQGAGYAPIHLVFGNALSDVGVVAAAMKDFEIPAPGARRATVVAKTWASVDAMIEEFRAMRSDAARVLFVVDWRSDWNHLWIATLLRSRSVREGRLSVAFVGGPEHALRWVGLPRGTLPASQVRIMPLQLWSVAMVEHHLGRIDIPAAEYREELRRLTGGFNRPMTQAIGGNVGGDRGERFQGRLERQHEKLLSDKSLKADLGLVGPMRPVFKRMPAWLDQGSITLYEITEGILPGIPDAVGLDGPKVAEFGNLLGLLSAEPLPPGAAEETRRFTLNPLLVEALKPITSVMQAAE